MSWGKQRKRQARIAARKKKRQKKLDKRHRKQAIRRGETWIVANPPRGFIPGHLDIDFNAPINWGNGYSYLGISRRPREEYDWRIEGF